MEPNVPDSARALIGLKSIAAALKDPDRIVLRIDPIILTAEGILRAMKVRWDAKEAGVTNRIIISFADMYPHVKQRFKNAGLQVPHGSFHAPLALRERMWEAMSDEMCAPNICGAPDMPCVGCVSDLDCKIFRVEPQTNLNPQRKGCECCGNKKQIIDDRQRCLHNCQYCYWKD